MPGTIDQAVSGRPVARMAGGSMPVHAEPGPDFDDDGAHPVECRCGDCDARAADEAQS